MKRRSELDQLLRDIDVALDAWLHQYASEMCDRKRVRELAAMVYEEGGTLAYIAGLQQRIRAGKSKPRKRRGR